MPRDRRSTPTGTLQHVIARFVDGKYLLDIPGARSAYLERLSRAVVLHDCTPIAFSLMSTHVHLALLAGERALGDLFASVHTSFALWVNRKLGRIGSVFACRFKTVTLEADLAAILVAYIHNNEPRAGVVHSVAESLWSSHRYYAGSNEPPNWLQVELGLQLCGFDPSDDGRRRFCEWVHSRSGDERSPVLNGEGCQDERAELRRQIPGCGEVMSPVAANPDTLSWRAWTPPASPSLVPWRGDPVIALHTASVVCDVPREMLHSVGGSREAARARAALILAWRDLLGRRQVEIATVLGLRPSTASQAYRRAQYSQELKALARAIADVCRQVE